MEKLRVTFFITTFVVCCMFVRLPTANADIFSMFETSDCDDCGYYIDNNSMLGYLFNFFGFSSGVWAFSGYSQIDWGKGHVGYIANYSAVGGQTLAINECWNGAISVTKTVTCQSASADLCGQYGTGFINSSNSYDVNGNYVQTNAYTACTAVTPNNNYPTAAVTNDNNGQKVSPGSRQLINNGRGTSRCIDNNSGNTYFTPRKTDVEFNDFLNAAGRLNVSVH